MRRLVVASLGLLISVPLAATPVHAAIPVHAATPLSAAPAPAIPASSRGVSNLKGVSFPDASHGWAVDGSSGSPVAGILATSNGGSTWTRQAPPSNIGFLNAVQFVSSTRGWAVGGSYQGGTSSGAIISTTDGGANWTGQTAAQTTQLTGVSFANALTGWAVGAGLGSAGHPIVIIHTVDGGTTWAPQSAPAVTGSLSSVAFSDTMHGVAVGFAAIGAAAIFVTSDGGTSWTSVAAPAGVYALQSVAFAPGTPRVWAAGRSLGAGGVLITSTDSGASWSSQTVPASFELDGVSMADATHGWVVGHDSLNAGVIFATTTGTTWTAQTVPTGTGLLAGIAATGTTAAFAVGAGTCGNAAILATADAGSTWGELLDQSPFVTDLNSVAAPDATHVFVAGDNSCANGIVLASSNAGAAWTLQTVPAGAGPLRAVTFVSPMVGWAAGGAPNGTAPLILGTTNGGQTWTAETLPATTGVLFGISFVDATHGWVVGKTTGFDAMVLVTSNGGTTWTQETLPAGALGNSLLQGVSFADAQHGWAVGSKSTSASTPLALATTNGGTTWQAQTLPASVTFLNSVSFVSNLAGWAVGDGQTSGAIVATTDGGVTWAAQAIPPNTDTGFMKAVTGVTAQTAWAMRTARTPYASVGPLKTTDGGATWSEQPISHDLSSLTSGSFASTTTGWVAGAEGCPDGPSDPAIYHTTDGGNAWTRQYGGCPAPGPAAAIYGLAPNNGPEPGGTTISISGVRFTGATAVSFGGTPAASFQVVNDTSITAVSPAGAGTADVRVVTPAGTSPSTIPDLYTWLKAVSVLPAMANGAYGGYVTVAYLKNSGDGTARVIVLYFDQDGHAVGTGDRMSLPVNGEATIRQDNGHGLPASTAGSAIVYSEQPLAAFVNEFAPGATDAGSYTAIPIPTGVGTTLYAPAIANGAYGGYTTGIGLLNLGSAPTDVTITYRDAAGGTTQTQTLTAVPTHGYLGLYSGDATLALPAGFAGTATIQSTSTPAQPLAAVVNETGPRGQFSSYDAVSSGSTTLNAPIMLNGGYGGYFTGMGIQNTSANVGTVTVQFYNSSGTHITPDVTASIAANAYLPLYQGAVGQGPPASVSGYTGVLTSTVPIAAIVNEVAPPSATATQSTSYNTFPAGVRTVHLPLVENAGSDGWTTGLGVMNTGSATTHVTVSYYDAATGSPLGVTQQTNLAPHAFYGPYQGAPAILPPGQRATAVLTTSAGGTIAVVCNEQGANAMMSYSGQ